MFNPLKQFLCEDIEKKFGIPKELTKRFVDCECSILPYAVVKAYQKYFRTPSFNELLDMDELAEYLLDEDVRFLPLREDEIRVRDNSLCDLYIEKGYIIKYSECDYKETGLYVIEFDGNTFAAYITNHTNDDIEFSFCHEDFEKIILKAHKVKVLGYAEYYRKPNETTYREITKRNV